METDDGVGIARQIGLSPVAFQRLVGGDVPETVAEKVGASTALALQRFVDGDTSIAIAERLKCSEVAVQKLRDAIGRQGAIGLIIGLCVPGPGQPR
ncbi:MAG: hypothetical protein LAO77_19395 [Acidobacteriia bacterium]|nr:hypothetical protein [Terriglobia bacterium]